MILISMTPVGFFRSWLQRLSKNSFLRKAALLSGGSAVGHIFTLAVSPALTRMYHPEEFGALGLFTSFLSVAGTGVAMQYEASIMSAQDQEEATYIAIGSALLVVVSSALSGIALWLLMHGSLLGFERLPWYAPVALAFVMCFCGYFLILRFLSLRQQNFRDVSRAMVVQNAARAILQTVLGAIGFRESGLILGETLGRGLGMGRMFKSTWPELRRNAAHFRWSNCSQVLWKYRRFPLLSFPSSLIDAVCASLAVPLIVELYGPKNGGCYALVWRVLALPSLLITLAVADTFHSQIAELARTAPSEVLSFFFRTTRVLVVVAVIPCAILLLWSKPLFVWALGPQWGLSGEMAAIIAPWYMSQFVVNPVSRLVLVLSGQETKLIWDVLCLICFPAAFYEAHRAGLDALGAVRLLSFTATALYIAYFAILVRIILRFHRSVEGIPMVAADVKEAS